MPRLRYLVIAPDDDPVARGVADEWGTPESLGVVTGGGTVRRLGREAAFVRHPGRGFEIEGLAPRLPAAIRSEGPTLVFASIHRSETGPTSFTVHPIGNPGPTASLGGTPGTLCPTDPGLMASALRRMAERAASLGVEATYEATHHGPASSLPAFFAELGGSLQVESPDIRSVRALASLLTDLAPDPADRTAVGVGGGHYAPHFTDLALRRHWAFGHILSKHVLGGLTEDVARHGSLPLGA